MQPMCANFDPKLSFTAETEGFSAETEGFSAEIDRVLAEWLSIHRELYTI